MQVEKFSKLYNQVEKDYDRLDFEFETEFMDDTYIYNNINIFVSNYDIINDTVVIKSCDERPILQDETTLNISVNDFLNIVH